MPNKYIVAIEIGSSKVIGVAGLKRDDGKIEVTAHCQQSSASFIRKGIIYNADLGARCIENIKGKLEEQLQKKIDQVYVCYSGQSVHSVPNGVLRVYDTERKILKEDIDSIYDENINTDYEGYRVLDAIPQEFSVGIQKLTDAVGVMASKVEGRYLNIISRSQLYTYIESCFKNVGVRVAEFRLTPLVVAEQLLNDAQKNSGCVLVDIGADTTTVSIYKSKLLRFLSVIPLGSDNITKDIMSLQLEHNEAEELKTSKFGEPYAQFSEEEGEAIIKTTPDGIQIKRKTLSAIIDARLTEILVNVKQQINESKYARESLIAGAFITGGCANMLNIANVFKEVVGIDKVTVRKNSQSADYKLPSGIKNSESKYLAVLGLLATANENCVSELEREDIFTPEPIIEGPIIANEPPVEPESVVEPVKKKGKGLKKWFSDFIAGLDEDSRDR